MKTALPPDYRRGVCPCGVVIDEPAIEDRLRAHVEQQHAEDARRDADGQIILRRATTMQHANRLACQGWPLLIGTP